MEIILLSGGSGKRLWPLSNSSRSKQFLKVLKSPDGNFESMLQRCHRQIIKAGINADITIATSVAQKDQIVSQLGDKVEIVTEPERRDTFPAIALATQFLAKVKDIDRNETVVVMPCDSFVEDRYFDSLKAIEALLSKGDSDLVLIGIQPTEPSEKYGYILPSQTEQNKVVGFHEKPSIETAKTLLEKDALWNGGVFAFKLGFLLDITDKYIQTSSFEDFRNRYSELPQISFDYEVVEKAHSIGYVEYKGVWKDLGSWDTLSEEMASAPQDEVTLNECSNTMVVHELDIPLVVHNVNNLIVATSPDGILVTRRDKSGTLKSALEKINYRPMYEERRWGEYKVIDHIQFSDGFCALTKQLSIKPGCSISYQRHHHRDEVWTFIDGDGLVVIDDKKREVKRGDTITISAGTLHALKAITPLTMIEVQRGTDLVEEDIERFDYSWE